MRKILALVISIFFIIIVNGQTVKKERKVVQVMPPQTFYLNGGTRAAFGGKSRTWFYISLPKNTIEWYYSFSTSKNENSNNSIELISQLTRLVDPTGITSIATTSILTPTGSGVCDIYLMDRRNADAFLNKVDNSGGVFYSQVSGSRQNYKNGTVKIKDIYSGNWYLGFKNPSATQGIYITFEVAAVVEETKIIRTEPKKQLSESEQKANTYGSLGWKAYERGEYDKCLLLSKKAIELNPNLGWVYNNIGLVQLIQGDYISAIDSYSTAIYLYKQNGNKKNGIKESLIDLRNLIEKHGHVEGSYDIIEMLKSER